MKSILKIKLLLSLIYFTTFSLKANVGMPGFWNLGGGTGFISIFDEDSIHREMIQMQREEVHILIYKGFAVVKGTYYFKNLSNEDVKFKVGYPINSSFENQQVFSVHFTDLYGLKVFQDSTHVKTQRLEKDDVKSFNDMGILENVENWYVWDCAFRANQTQKVTVYFMVDTNSAALVRGYSRDYNNGFTYILESGKAWAKQIEQGSIHMHLMDKLAPEDIIGLSPIGAFKLDAKNQRLLYEFNNLEPDNSHNILLRYGYGDENFDFDAIQKKADFYYEILDQKQKILPDSQNLKPFKADDFKVHDWKGSLGFTLAMFILVFGFPVLIILIGIGLLISYMRKRRKSV